jgi:hypothetical protein
MKLATGLDDLSKTLHEPHLLAITERAPFDPRETLTSINVTRIGIALSPVLNQSLEQRECIVCRVRRFRSIAFREARFSVMPKRSKREDRLAP